MPSSRKVVVVHDYLTQRGGAERVVLEMLRAFPGSSLVTSCWNPATTFEEFADYSIETLWMDRVPSLRRDPRRAFPFLAAAFRNHVIADADVVLISSSGWAHRVTSAAPRVVYCHNPARWLYQPDDYFADAPRWVKDQFVRRFGLLRQTDGEAAASAARYLVNSSTVAGRVAATYGLDARVVPPPRGLSPEGPLDPIAGVEPGYLLTISRARGYKHTQQIVEAVESMPGERLVVVGGAVPSWASDKVTVLRDLSDAGLRWLYLHAGAVVAMAHEDFGLTPVEAQALGTPSVVLRAGGYLDSTVENRTGVFADDSSVAAIVDAIMRVRSRLWDADEIRTYGERFAPATFRSRLQDEVADVLGLPASERRGDTSNPLAG